MISANVIVAGGGGDDDGGRSGDRDGTDDGRPRHYQRGYLGTGGGGGSSWARTSAILRRPAYVAGGVFVGFVLVAILAVVLVLTVNPASYDDAPGDVAIDYSKALVVSDERDLWALDLDSQAKSVLISTTKGIADFDLRDKSTIFYREYGWYQVNSLSSKYRNLSYAREWEPSAIAVDVVTDNVYVIDGLAELLIVYDVQSTNYGVVLADLKDPIGMAIDPSQGLLFVVQQFDSILKLNTDGTSVEKIISSNVTAVTVDAQTSRLFWSADSSIHSSDYTGNKRLTVAALPSTAISLGVSGSRLFWVSATTHASNLRSLWTCKMSNSESCSQADFHQIPFDDPKRIKVYTGESAKIKNPCEIANGGCKQLCLAKPQAEYTCACFIGFQLEPDSESCSPVNEYVLYTRGNFVRGRILDASSDTFVEAILPIRIQPTTLKNKETVDFDYSVHTNTFAYSDDNSIKVVSLKQDMQSNYTRDACLKYVSVDWVTNDIYYVKDNCRTLDKATIVIMKPKENEYFWKTLHTFDLSQGYLKSLVVHPNRGCYFYTKWHPDVALLYRKCGSEPKVFSHKVSVNETGLALDYAEDRLYWFSQDQNLLYNADLDSGDERSIDLTMIRDPRHVAVYGRHAYVANSTGIWRLDKITGSEIARLTSAINGDDVDRKIGGVRIYSASLQTISEDNVCAVQNGDCQQFCFRNPKTLVSGANEMQKLCLCDDFRTIMSDGKSCKIP